MYSYIVVGILRDGLFDSFIVCVLDNSVLGLTSGSGVEHKILDVGLESLDILFEGLLASVFSSMVDGDSDAFGEFGVEACFFELHQTEASSEPLVHVVSLSLGPDDGSQSSEGSRIGS